MPPMAAAQEAALVMTAMDHLRTIQPSFEGGEYHGIVQS